MDEIVQDFLIESKGGLDLLDEELSRLNTEVPTGEGMSQMVRAIHTIKGASGFLGFAHIERMTKAGEHVLLQLAEGHLPPSEEVRSQVQAMSAAVRRMLEHIEKNGRDGENDYPDLLATLNRLAGVAPSASK